MSAEKYVKSALSNRSFSKMIAVDYNSIHHLYFNFFRLFLHCRYFCIQIPPR